MSGTLVRQVKRAEIFTVELEEPAASGYQWNFIPQEHLEIRGIHTRIVDEAPVVGSSVIKIFLLEAKELGEYELVFDLVRPWEKKNPVRHHHENIDVSEDR